MTGKYIAQSLYPNKNGSHIRIMAWIENNYHKDSLFEAPMFSESEFFDAYRDISKEVIFIIAIKHIYLAQTKAISLMNKGFKNVFIPIPELTYAELPVVENDGLSEYLKRVPDSKPILPYLEFQVADKCNLKCNACMHFSNLIETDSFADYEEFDESLKRLSHLFYSIDCFRLMGGEPLLNPDLDKFARLARKRFPLANIKIATNGLLIPKTSDFLIKTMRDYNIEFDITQYPPTTKIINKIIGILRENRIKYTLYPPIKSFLIRMSMGETDHNEVFYNGCLSKTCTFLRSNKIFVCPHIPMLYECRDYFGFDISMDEFRKNCIELDNEEIDGWDILERINSPFTMCRFCSPNSKTVDWTNVVPKREDWIV